MNIKKGDMVIVISGKDRKKTGKVLRALPQEAKIIVEGINLRTKHLKARRAGKKGQKITAPAPFSISNIKIICSKCGKATRIGYRLDGDKKYRICKKCGADIS